jgi:hypothetical protein
VGIMLATLSMILAAGAMTHGAKLGENLKQELEPLLKTSKVYPKLTVRQQLRLAWKTCVDGNPFDFRNENALETSTRKMFRKSLSDHLHGLSCRISLSASPGF